MLRLYLKNKFNIYFCYIKLYIIKILLHDQNFAAFLFRSDANLQPTDTLRRSSASRSYEECMG